MINLNFIHEKSVLLNKLLVKKVFITVNNHLNPIEKFEFTTCKTNSICVLKTNIFMFIILKQIT